MISACSHQVRKFREQCRRDFVLMKGRSWLLKSIICPQSLKERAFDFLRKNQEDMVYVLGSGRSGTQLISSLLSASGNAVVYHEPNFREDVVTMDSLRRDQACAERYWMNFRNIEVYRRWKENSSAKIYGEVNGTIRYQALAVKKLYPQAKMFLISRDGHGVVRSVMGWPQFYGLRSKGAYALAPLKGNPFYDEWKYMTRFEKVCWSWRDTHEFLMELIPVSHCLRLESLTKDYEYFTKHFSENIGIDISESCWSTAVSQKSRNATSNYSFPAWNEWSTGEKEGFMRICGETMTKLGYSMSDTGV